MKKGFTLLELMIVLAIFTVIMGSIFTALSIGKNSFYTGSVQVEMQQEARKGLDRMVKELRQTNNFVIPSLPADDIFYNTITFRLPVTDVNGYTNWTSDVTYSLGGLNGTQLLRMTVNGTEILANNINSIQFRRTTSTPNVIDIRIQAVKNTLIGHTIQAPLNCQVNMRN
ncbi:MAG: prepilin-type N-terminal cleavage/methylation domain-containing protein [Candidatus Omnitrophota bacterium]